MVTASGIAFSPARNGNSVTPVNRSNTSFRAQTCHAAGLFGPYILCCSLATSQILEQLAGTSLPLMYILRSLALIWCIRGGRNEAQLRMLSQNCRLLTWLVTLLLMAGDVGPRTTSRCNFSSRYCSL